MTSKIRKNITNRHSNIDVVDQVYLTLSNVDLMMKIQRRLLTCHSQVSLQENRASHDEVFGNI